MSEKFLPSIPAYSPDPELIKIAANKVFGFWIYLMSDCVLFATLFATYVMLNAGHSPTHAQSSLFNLPVILIETFCLLTSSFTFGLTINALEQENKKTLLMWIFVTFILGLTFVSLEIHDFYHLIITGNSPTQSAFWSSFFTLVGTHGLHVSLGLVWMAVMIVQILRQGIILPTRSRLKLLSLFWHFLDIIWICIFTFVYLLGSLQ
jgi:cytochrome o ubiquinol oxidase subunit III